jgi:hypothetical protein
MNSDNASELIEQYLLGKLDAATARSVEARAETDAGFARELQLQKDILQGVELFGDEQIRAKIAAVDHSLAAKGFFDTEQNAQVDAQGSTKSLLQRYKWVIGAVLVLLSGMGLWWWTRQQPAAMLPIVPPTAPVQETAKPALNEVVDNKVPDIKPKLKPDNPTGPKYLALARSSWSSPDFSNVRSAKPSAPSLLALAITAFQKQDYHAVIQITESVDRSDANYWPLSELYAHAWYFLGRTDLAAARFRQIEASGQLPFSERAAWYLLLCDLASYPQSKKEFDAMLKKILADEGHPYHGSAEKIAKQVQ